MKLFVPITILLLASFGCSKDKDTEDPIVTLTTPTLGQVYNNGDAIRIMGTVRDNKVVNELFIRVTHSVTGAEIIVFESNPETTATSFDHTISASSAIHNYRVQVVAKDKAKNDARKTVDFTCN